MSAQYIPGAEIPGTSGPVGIDDSGSDSADVLVIGAGAAGAALVWSLARRGLDVLCLEQGDWVPSDEIPKNHADWEVRGRHYWNPSPGKRRGAGRLPGDATSARTPSTSYMYSAVGGSAIGYGAHFWRFAAVGLSRPRRSTTSASTGRSATRTSIPYYEINEADDGHVRRRRETPCSPAEPAVPLPPDRRSGAMGERWIDGFEQARLVLVGAEPGDPVARTTGAARPASNRGFCAFGCPSGALAPARRTPTGPRRSQPASRLRTRARVREVTVDEPTASATGALYYDADGRLRSVTREDRRDRRGNGLGTPRLLLMSKSPRVPGRAREQQRPGRQELHGRTCRRW